MVCTHVPALSVQRLSLQTSLTQVWCCTCSDPVFWPQRNMHPNIVIRDCTISGTENLQRCVRWTHELLFMFGDDCSTDFSNVKCAFLWLNSSVWLCIGLTNISIDHWAIEIILMKTFLLHRSDSVTKLLCDGASVPWILLSRGLNVLCMNTCWFNSFSLWCCYVALCENVLLLFIDIKDCSRLDQVHQVKLHLSTTLHQIYGG